MNGMTWFTDDNNKHAQDENANSLSIKKILKRLNDLESIVQDQENLLAEQIIIIKNHNEQNRKLECIVEEQVIIIKSNNERICMLESIVEEHVESLTENIISIERNLEEQRELFDETIDKIIIDHEKIDKIRIVEENNNSLAEKLSGLDDIVDYHNRLIDEVIDEIVVEREKVNTLWKWVEQLQVYVFGREITRVSKAVIQDLFGLYRCERNIDFGTVSTIKLDDSLLGVDCGKIREIVSVIDKDWSINKFLGVATLINSKQVNVLPEIDLISESLCHNVTHVIRCCSVDVRKMFVDEEKIISSHHKLKPFFGNFKMGNWGTHWAISKKC